MLSYTFSFFQVHTSSTYKGYWNTIFSNNKPCKGKASWFCQIKWREFHCEFHMFHVCLFVVAIVTYASAENGMSPILPHLVAFYKQILQFHVPPIAIGYHRLSLPLPLPSTNQLTDANGTFQNVCTSASLTKFTSGLELSNPQRAAATKAAYQNARVFQRWHLLGLNVTVRICNNMYFW